MAVSRCCSLNECSGVEAEMTEMTRSVNWCPYRVAEVDTDVEKYACSWYLKGRCVTEVIDHWA